MHSMWRAFLLIVAVGIIAFLVIIFSPDEKSKQTMENNNSKFSITSSVFSNDDFIPQKFSCDGENINPPLLISGIPEGAVSLALLVDDPDIPQQFKDSLSIDSFDHWTLFNIPVTGGELSIDEGNIPNGSVVGENSRGNDAYTGPCPPPDMEPTEHRYFFKVYALDTQLSLDNNATKGDVKSAMDEHILAEAELVGRFDRSK